MKWGPYAPKGRRAVTRKRSGSAHDSGSGDGFPPFGCWTMLILAIVREDQQRPAEVRRLEVPGLPRPRIGEGAASTPNSVSSSVLAATGYATAGFVDSIYLTCALFWTPGEGHESGESRGAAGRSHEMGGIRAGGGHGSSV
jgi:hypothetical protein